MEQKKFPDWNPEQKQAATFKKEPFIPNLAFDQQKLSEYRSKMLALFDAEGPLKSKVELMIKPKLPAPITAGIDMHTWDTKLAMRPDLAFSESPSLLDFLESRNITDAVERTLLDTGRHEIGHWEYRRGDSYGCPYDQFRHYSLIVEPIYQELKATGKFSEEDCQAHALREANAVADLINNHNVSRVLAKYGKDYPGQGLFWYLQGQLNGKYPDDFDLFIKLSIATIGDEGFSKLLGQYMGSNKKVDEAVSRLSKLFLPEYMDSAENWEALARSYSREVAPFLKENEQRKHQCSPDDSPGPPGKGGGQGEGKLGQDDKGDNLSEGKDSSEAKDGSGGGGKGSGEEKEKEKGEGSEGSGGQGKEGKGEEKEGGKGPGSKGSGGEGAGKESGSGSEQEGGALDLQTLSWGLGGDLTPEEIADIMFGRKAGQGIPFYIETEDGLDGFYRGLARKIPLEASGMPPSANMNIIPLSYVRFDPDSHSEEDLSSNKLVFNPATKSLERSAVKMRFPIDIPLQKEKRNMPEFFFTLMDTSGSMIYPEGDTSIAPWGDKSYYHHGLLSFYGLLRFFESKGLLHKVNFAGAIFSDVTLGATGIDELKHILLNPATGGTRIDMRVVMKHIAGAKNAVFGMISDGAIFNWGEIKNEFTAIAKQNQFFMIQIGSDSETSRDLRAAGLPVFTVASHKDIVHLAVKLTAERYNRAIRSQLEAEKLKYK